MRISSITKNAGKACNNRLYRHIRTFEKIVKNYFVIYEKQDNLIDIPVENRDPDEYYEIIDENTFIYHNTYSVIDTETGIPTGQLYTEIRTYKRAE